MPAGTKLTASAKLLVRRPAAEVFAAFVDPKVLQRFWLARASAPLEVGRTVRWRFRVPGVSDTLTATALVPGKRIAVEWSDGTETEWLFEAASRERTIVLVTQTVKGNARERIAAALDATEGHTLVLCDLKLWLERGIESGIVKDKATLIARAMKRAKKR